MRRILVYLIVCLFPLIVKAQSHSIEYSFKLPSRSTTSAGVFTENGELIRTLWNNVELPQGTHNRKWDGLDDEGNLASNAKYKITVQTNNVKYEWEGARIGNTSKDLEGGNKHRAYSPANNMVINGNYAYYTTGFNEGTSSMHKFALTDKQVIERVLSMSGHQISATNVTTDGKLVYWAGFDSWSDGEWPAFIIATNVDDDKENIFETGQAVSMKQGRTYNSAIDLDKESKITGLSVTKKLNYLFVSHGTANELRVLNKTTGRLIHKLSLTAPGALLVDRADSYLWVMSDDKSLKKYPINQDGTLAKATLQLSGISDPLAFDISTDNATILISDGNGGSEMLRAFSTKNGNALWTFGSGSYDTDPNVKNDKFYFVNRNSSRGRFRTFVAFEPNGSFWIGDTGNYRMQHYSSDRTFIDRIMYLANSYNAAADKNNPTRVFNEYMEFKIDYSKPLAINNGSWELVRNYRAALKTEFFGKDEMRAIFKSVVTLKNGRTYATVRKNNKYAIVELPENAPMRFTGIEFAKNQSVLIMTDGSLRSYVNRKEPNLASFYTQDLKGFDANNNPVWSERYPLSEIAVKRSDPHDYNQNRNGQSTKSGLLVSFMKGAGDEDTGYHLGAIKVGESNWLWRTSKSTPSDYKGDFPTDGAFDIGNGVTGHSAGAGVFVVDNNILWNYNGEFWKNAQTNYWNHFSDKGLMIGQFGTWRDKPGNLKRGPAMMAGNAFSGEVVKVGNDLFVYHNDESQHSGTHRWKISGLNSIKSIDVPVEITLKGRGLLGRYHSGKYLDNANIKTSRIDQEINFNWGSQKPAGTELASSEDFSVSWTGFVSPAFSEIYTFYAMADDGVKLWIDGKLIIDKWQDQSAITESSGNILLEANKHYSIRMEYYQKAAKSAVSLSWKSARQEKSVIPSSRLIPAAPDNLEAGIDLMANLPSFGILKDNMYGWNRYPVNQDSTEYYAKWWNVQTGTKSFKAPDVHVVYRQPSNTSHTITRNLGDVSDQINEWTLSGNVNYSGNYANTSGGGSYLEVLDNNDKIIARFYSYVDKGTTYLYVNNNKTMIASGQDDINLLFKTYQKLEIKGGPTGIIVKYGPYDAVKTTVYDQESNWKKPKTLRLYFFTKSKNSGRAISMEGFRFATLTVNSSEAEKKLGQKIDFSPIESQVFGSVISLQATASSNLPISYVVKSGQANISGDLVTLTGVGTVIIEAQQSGNDKFHAADVVSQSFDVIKGSQIISFENISEKRMGDPVFSLTATASSKLPVSFKVKSGPAVFSDHQLSLTGVGTVVIEASQAGNENYTAAPLVTKSFAVKPAETAGKVKTAQTISFSDIPTKNATDAPFAISAKASSGLPVTYVVKSGRATISGNTVTLTGGGSPVVIEALQAGDSKYNAATTVSKSFTVNKASQTILFNSLPSKSVTDAPFAINATASSELPVKYSVKSGPATINGNLVTLKGEGTVVIEATQSGNSKYKPAKTVSQSFEVKSAQITKTAQTITFGTISAKYVTDAPFILNATASSKLPVAYRVQSGPATITGNLVTLKGEGTVVIEATQSGNSKYKPAKTVSQSFEVKSAQITKTAQTITFGSISAKYVTDAPFKLNATASSKLPVAYRVQSGPATISGNTVTLTGVGTVVVEASQAGNNIYNSAAVITRSIVVQAPKKADQTITFPNKIGLTNDYASFTLMATASSGLPVSYRIISGPVTISRNVVTAHGWGDAVIEAYQPGDDKFNPAVAVTRTFAAEGNNSTTVVKLNQTINFSPIGTRYKKEQFTLSANASSGLPVIYRVISGPAVIMGSKITLTDVGTVVVEASQAGSDRYNKAVSTTQSFKVNNTSQKAGVNSDNLVNNAIQNINDEAAAANKNFDFKIYPNPASANTTVEFMLIESSEVNLELFSLNGMLIKRIQLGLREAKTLNSYNLNTTDLPAGVYILRVLSRTDALSKRLLIVK